MFRPSWRKPFLRPSERNSRVGCRFRPPPSEAAWTTFPRNDAHGSCLGSGQETHRQKCEYDARCMHWGYAIAFIDVISRALQTWFFLSIMSSSSFTDAFGIATLAARKQAALSPGSSSGRASSTEMSCEIVRSSKRLKPQVGESQSFGNAKPKTLPLCHTVSKKYLVRFDEGSF